AGSGRRVPGRVCSQGAHLLVEGVEQGAEVLVAVGGRGVLGLGQAGLPVLNGHVSADGGRCRGWGLAHVSSSVIVRGSSLSVRTASASVSPASMACQARRSRASISVPLRSWPRSEERRVGREGRGWLAAWCYTDKRIRVE